MIALSCANCWHNALQHDTVGLAHGYCVLHGVVLTDSAGTTCGQLMRKDLSLPSADAVRLRHRRRFAETGATSLYGGNGFDVLRVDGDEGAKVLETDEVGGEVANYRQLRSTIESLSRLSCLPGPRAEVAMLSLGRGYVANCVAQHGSWTSGLHLYRWTRQRIVDVPQVRISDLWIASAVSPVRQIEMAQWSIVMLRLALIADLGVHAGSNGRDGPYADEVAVLQTLLDEAAEATGIVSLRKLLRWLGRHGVKRLDAALPEDRLSELARDLHRRPICQ